MLRGGMTYVEEREFTLRFALRCEFPDDYEGEEDGGAWAEAWDAVAAEVVAAAIEVVRRRSGWRVRPANRGRPTTDEITLQVERLIGQAP
jgi:hypothetical protein